MYWKNTNEKLGQGFMYEVMVIKREVMGCNWVDANSQKQLGS
jgi:hypothetical protein